MKIAFFEIEGWEEAALKAAFPGDELFLSKEKLCEEKIPSETDFEMMAIFVGSQITDKVLAAFPNLKFLTTRSVGFDHINTKAAASRSIAVA